MITLASANVEDVKTLRELSVNGGPGVRRVLLSDSRQRAALDVEKTA